MNKMAMEVTAMFAELSVEEKKVAAERAVQILGADHPLALQMRKMTE